MFQAPAPGQQAQSPLETVPPTRQYTAAEILPTPVAPPVSPAPSAAKEEPQPGEFTRMFQAPVPPAPTMQPPAARKNPRPRRFPQHPARRRRNRKRENSRGCSAPRCRPRRQTEDWAPPPPRPAQGGNSPACFDRRRLRRSRKTVPKAAISRGSSRSCGAPGTGIAGSVRVSVRSGTVDASVTAPGLRRPERRDAGVYDSLGAAAKSCAQRTAGTERVHPYDFAGIDSGRGRPRCAAAARSYGRCLKCRRCRKRTCPRCLMRICPQCPAWRSPRFNAAGAAVLRTAGASACPGALHQHSADGDCGVADVSGGRDSGVSHDAALTCGPRGSDRWN